MSILPALIQRLETVQAYSPVGSETERAINDAITTLRGMVQVHPTGAPDLDRLEARARDCLASRHWRYVALDPSEVFTLCAAARKVNPEKMREAFLLHVAYEATPTDRGGSQGPKGRAYAAWIAARDAALKDAE